MTERVVSPKSRESEVALDRALRPHRLSDVIGQDRVRESLRILIEAARLREEALDHVLLCDAAMKPWLGGPSAQADPGVTEIKVPAALSAGAGCGGPVEPDSGPAADSGPLEAIDGGAVADGASVASDGSAPFDSGAIADSTPPGSDTAVTSADGGLSPSSSDDGGCGCEVGRTQSPALALPWVLLLLALIRRRRRSG